MTESQEMHQHFHRAKEREGKGAHSGAATWPLVAVSPLAGYLHITEERIHISPCPSPPASSLKETFPCCQDTWSLLQPVIHAALKFSACYALFPKSSPDPRQGCSFCSSEETVESRLKGSRSIDQTFSFLLLLIGKEGGGARPEKA